MSERMTDENFDVIEALYLRAVMRDHPRKLGRRWTPAEIDALKSALNSWGLLNVSDALGSLQFDLVDAECASRVAPSPAPAKMEEP